MARLDWIEFSKICEKLIKRELTGHAARDQIILLKDKSYKDEWNFFTEEFYKRYEMWVILERTVNNVAKNNRYEHYIIPVFSVN